MKTMKAFFSNALVWGWMATLVVSTQSLSSQGPWDKVFMPGCKTLTGFNTQTINVGNQTMFVQFNLTYPETRIPISNEACDSDDEQCNKILPYVPEDSPSFHANDSAPKYALSSTITGEYGMDQVTIFGVNRTGLPLTYSFVQIEVEDLEKKGTIGFGFANQEYTNKGDDGYIYDNLMETLKKSPLRALFSVCSSNLEFGEAVLLFGAIDSAKYDHDIGFRTYDVYSPLSYGKEGPPTDWGIVMDEFAIYDDSSEEALLEVDTSNYTTVVDALSNGTFLAPAIFQQVVELFNLTEDEDGYGYYVRTDDIRDKYISLTFGDLEYKASFWNLTRIEYMQETALLKIFPNTEDYNRIGLPMLQYDGYVVYDYENRTVSLGKLKVLSDGEVDLYDDIVTISNTLPDSKKVTNVPKETRPTDMVSETDSSETDSSKTDSSETGSSETEEPSDSSETSTSSAFGSRNTAKWSLLTLVLFYLM